MVLAMNSEQACISWLANQSWLSVFGEGTRVKKREFAVIAHRIQVNQVQGNTIEEIYKQNPGLRISVEILRVAFSKKLLQSGRTTDLLVISVAELEQANRLIDTGLVWYYKLYNCKLFSRDCVVTQCFKCYQYRYVARVYQNLQCCRYCAAPGHATNDCLGKEDQSKYCTGNKGCTLYR
jgi:hypothetical protein